MTTLQWRIESGPIYIRLLELDELAQDSGSTPEQQSERKRLDAESSRLLGLMLAEKSNWGTNANQ